MEYILSNLIAAKMKIRSHKELDVYKLAFEACPVKYCKNMKSYYVYVLRSKLDGKFYTGFTSDLEKRIEEHNSGKVYSTSARVPFEIVYYEACICIDDAIHREKYLKSTYGKRYVKNRIKNYLKKI
jgi:putative endonuclease